MRLHGLWVIEQVAGMDDMMSIIVLPFSLELKITGNQFQRFKNKTDV
jgi:hypothetical protein